MIGTLQDIMRDMEKGVFEFTVDGHCSGCGSCCSDFLPISSKEIKIIGKYIKKHNIKACKHIIPSANPVVDFTCPFRDNTARKCTIYPVRPAICRDFQCDKPRKKFGADKTMYHGKYRVVFMREEFFGHD